MVSIDSLKFSSTHHDAHFVYNNNNNNGAIQSKIDDKPGYA